MKSVKKTSRIIAKAFFALLLLYLISQRIDFEQFYEIISRVHIKYFLFMCLLWPLSVLVSSFKWNLILREYGIDVSFRKSFDLYWIGSFFNNFLPSSFGGDSYKFIYINRIAKNKKSQVVSSILLERGIGFFTMIFSLVVFGLFFLSELRTDKLVFLLYVIALTFFLVFLVFLGFALFSTKQIRLPRNTRYKFLNKVTKGINILFAFKNKRVIILSVVCSVVFLCLSIFSLHLAFRAFDHSVSFILLSFLIPIINLTGVVPFSINSLGIKEGVGVYLFSVFGIAPELTLAVLLMNRILLMICSATGGLRYIVHR